MIYVFLYYRVRIWDLVILIPNAIFLFFLVVRLKRAVVKLQRTNSPIFFAFYGMVSSIHPFICYIPLTTNRNMQKKLLVISECSL